MRVALVNYVWSASQLAPEELLAEYGSLTGWAQAIRAAGVEEVSVFQRYRAPASIQHDGITYRFCATRGAPEPSTWTIDCEALHEAVARIHPQLVHVNGVLFPRHLTRLRRRLPSSAALVVQDHGGLEPHEASTVRRAWIRRGLARADALLVSSTGQATDWRRSGAVPPAVALYDVMECSTGVVPLERDEARRRSGVGGAPAVLWVGRLNANKDPLTVLRGVARFFAICPDARLTMVYAEQPLEAAVRRMIDADSALRPRVHLAGRVAQEDMPAYFSAADFFVLGSHREGSGYALIEALACGVMPVVTDIPSFRALTADGAQGELWPPGDATALAHALVRATRRTAPTHRAARRAHFDRHFSWPQLGQRARNIYDDVRKRRASRPKPNQCICAVP